MGIFFDQERLDGIHEMLSRPIADMAKLIEKYSVKYPLLDQIGAANVPRIFEQGPNVVHLLASLLNHELISLEAKKSLAMAAAYLIWPLDILPEGIIGPIGYVDDILVIVYVFNVMLNGTHLQDKEILTSLWKGRPADLEMLRERVLKLEGIKLAFQKFSLGKNKP